MVCAYTEIGTEKLTYPEKHLLKEQTVCQLAHYIVHNIVKCAMTHSKAGT